MNYPAAFERQVAGIIQREGGFVDHPDDSGGATCWGITQRLARKHGYQGHMRDLTQQEARRIYKLEFWDPLDLDRLVLLSDAVAEELFDTSVNVGQTPAGSWLQRCLNANNLKGTIYPDLKVDGQIGPVTLRALEAYLKRRQSERGELILLRQLNSLQGAFYLSLAERREKDESFVYGWFAHRVVI